MRRRHELSVAVLDLLQSVSARSKTDEDLTPVADALRERKRQEEEARRRAEAETFRTAQPGQEIKGHGLFVGIYEPTGRDGKSLGLAFNVVAAPEDLTGEALSYNNTLEALAALEGWHGHDGSNYRNQNELIKALQDGAYKGGWIVPPREVLYGRKAGAGKIRGALAPDKEKDKENHVQPDNLRAHQHKKGFRNTYKNGAYWSSDMMSIGDLVWNIRVTDGIESHDNPRTNPARCRPVRLIPVDTEYTP